MTVDMRGIALCATPRSGSNYACELLLRTGVLGHPTDYFNAPGRRAKGWTDYPGTYALQLGVVLSHGSTSNGVYAFKVFPEHVEGLERANWTNVLPDLRWVHLRRADVLGQAISLVIAEQTGRWRATGEAHAPARYDAAAIDGAVRRIASADAEWRAFFATRGIRPLEVTYESLSADPNGFVRAIAALAGVSGVPDVDPSGVSLAVQRDATNEAWRERYLAQRPASAVRAPVAAAPRLSVHMLTRDSAPRLARVIAHARAYADEIVIGVDATSSDDTLAVASRYADVVYRFRLGAPGQLGPARMLAFEYCRGDWILSLDDDETMEPTFDALAADLMRDERVTHYYFPRKWIVAEDPPAYVRAAPWYPNWAPRLYRNDRSLFWKPPIAHSMYYIQGQPAFDERTAILHFEPVWCDDAKRAAKIVDYRAAGASATSETFYAIDAGAPRAAVDAAPDPGSPPERDAVVHDAVHALAARPNPPWGVEYVRAEVPSAAAAGSTIVGEITVRNTGALAWTANYAQPPANAWPSLRLTYHLLDAAGNVLVWLTDHRALMPRFVPPGAELAWLVELRAPDAPGDYILAWDMMSEGHAWFSECGSPMLRLPLRVTPRTN